MTVQHCPLCRSNQVMVCEDANNPSKSFAQCRICKCRAPLSAWEGRAEPDYERKWRHEMAELVMRHIDRMNDVCAEDTAEEIIDSFTRQFDPPFDAYLAAKFPNRERATRPAGPREEGMSIDDFVKTILP